MGPGNPKLYIPIVIKLGDETEQRNWSKTAKARYVEHMHLACIIDNTLHQLSGYERKVFHQIFYNFL